MSKDQDAHQRLWLSLGYGGKTAPVTTWRYWKHPQEPQCWIIAAPNGLAEFVQRNRTVFYKDREILTAESQWQATWSALGFFYAKLVPILPKPPIV